MISADLGDRLVSMGWAICCDDEHYVRDADKPLVTLTWNICVAALLYLAAMRGPVT